MTSIAMKLQQKWELSDEVIAFFNWLFIWIFLINFTFMAMWIVGAPPREYEIVVVGMVGLLVRRMPYWIQATAFITCLAGCVLAFIGGLFNLSFVSLLYSLQFFAELNPTGSIEYIIIAILLVALSGIALRAMKSPSYFDSKGLLLAALAIILSLSAFDHYLSIGNRGHYKQNAPTGTVFESAVSQSDFAVAANGDRHLLLIMVESLGVPVDNPEMDRLIFAAYDQPSVTDRYDISEGTSLFFNSTTAGEIREMCGRWGDYHNLVEKKETGCLPTKLAQQGYDTRAIHSFKGWFFERRDWYPNIGFGKQEFWEELEKKGVSACGGVFAGACDEEIPALLGGILREAEKPTFLYWLTVNTHMPIPSGMLQEKTECSAYSKKLAAEFPMICRQLQLTDAIDRNIVKQITASDFPDTDILIVGDHMPPYFDLSYRSQFDPGRVPWIYLKRR